MLFFSLMFTVSELKVPLDIRTDFELAFFLKDAGTVKVLKTIVID